MEKNASSAHDAQNGRTEMSSTQSNPDPAKKKNKKSPYLKWVILFVILVIVGGAVFSYWYFFLRGYVSTDDAFIEGNRLTVSAKVLGRITQLTAVEGDTVFQGELLAQLDTTDLHAQLAQATAGLNYAKENVSLAEVKLEQAQEDFKRAALQYKEKIVTPESYDHARQALAMAKAQLAISKSEITRSRAAVNVIRSQMQNTRIVSAMHGVVAKKWVLEGDVVQPAQPIYTIYDPDDVWITANFEETKLTSIKMNAPVEISIDAYSNRKFSGRVINLPAAAASKFSLIPPNNAAGNFTKVTQRVPVKISLNRPEGGTPDPLLLLPGMSVTVKIPTGGSKE